MPGRPERTALRASLGVAGVASLVPLAVSLAYLGRYGWDRDELYFLAAARHPAFGYVDYPPLVAWIGWVVDHTAGASLGTLRLVTLAFALASIPAVVLTARELGGTVRAQAYAAGAWTLSPFLLGSGSIFHPTMLDLGLQSLTVALLVRIRVRPDPRLWPVLGVVAGLGIEAKYTMVVTLGCVLAAIAVTPHRRVLATRGPWIAAGIALVLWAPNLAWQAANDWPSLAFSSSQRTKTAADTPVPAYLVESLLLLGAAAIPAVAGLRLLWRRDRRSLALMPVLVWLVWLVERGRPYYPLPVVLVAVAAGAIAIERRRVAIVASAVVGCVVLAVAGPLVIPVRSTGGMVQSGIWKDTFYKDEIGWVELTDQVAAAWRRARLDPASAVVLAGNYGEAGAPLSGHLSWQYWRPVSLPQRTALTVGLSDGDLRQLCTEVRQLAQIENRYHLDNEERGRTIDLCQLRGPLGSLWERSVARATL